MISAAEDLEKLLWSGSDRFSQNGPARQWGMEQMGKDFSGLLNFWKSDVLVQF